MAVKPCSYKTNNNFLSVGGKLLTGESLQSDIPFRPQQSGVEESLFHNVRFLSCVALRSKWNKIVVKKLRFLYIFSKDNN